MSDQLLDILRQAKHLARQYYALTGKPLGVTGEVAEFEAAQALGLELTGARQAGYDALERGGGRTKRLQIKGRCLQEGHKPGQRLGSIRLEHDWDAVLMVLLDGNFDAVEIHEADRGAIEKALQAPGSKARNERGSLGVSKFKSIGKLRWRRNDMSDHPKTDLKEKADKGELPPTKFSSHREGGTDHAPGWVATAALPDGTTATGVGSSKGAAEASAAAALKAKLKPKKR